MTWGGVIKHKKIIIFSVLIIIVTILSIVVINNVTNKSYAASTYLYDKVEQDATTNGYGGTYTGDHADTVQNDGTEIVGTKDIYYYTTSGHNNVKFGDFCWQIIRTTDTGGVKLIYNGVYDSSTKCEHSYTHEYTYNTTIELRSDFKYFKLDTTGYCLNAYYSYSSNCGGGGGSGASLPVGSSTGVYSCLDGYYNCSTNKSYAASSCHTLYYINSWNGNIANVTAYERDDGSIYSVNPDKPSGYSCFISNYESYGWKQRKHSFDNSFDSIGKEKVENWYENNLTRYDELIEDVVYCSDRKRRGYDQWIGYTSDSLYFQNYDSITTLNCPYEQDRFTTNNTLAKNDYKVGLITAPEARLEGSDVAMSGVGYATMSPTATGNNIHSYAYVTRSGNVSSTSDSSGIRPVVSLDPAIKYSSGTGTVSNPYIIDGVGDAMVKYSAGSYGTMSGTTEEEVSSGGHPTGRNITPNSGYYFAGWVANKNVTLSNNTTISKGTVMTKAQTQSINVTASITLTAKYYKGWLYDKVEQDATTNGYGNTYTGDHADTVQNDGTSIVGDEVIYYYSTAGHNNVKLGGFCWQIIRTTDTGGVKLIYNGVYSSSTKCNNSGTARQLLSTSMFNNSTNNRIYVGYKYIDSSYNDTDSSIKPYIDIWYSGNMKSYTSLLEDIVFCNDRTGSTSSSSAATGTTWAGGSSGSAFYYHNYDAGYNKLSCYYIRDRFTTNNTKAQLTYPVALATQPEVLLMDSTTKNTGQDWWLLSPNSCYSIKASGRYVAVSGGLGSASVTSTLGVRPVVSLAPNMTYIGGSGTVSSPYIVEGPILEPSLAATFYYQSSSTSGTTNIESVTTSCTPSGGSCTAEIPSAVRNSVGTYNNAYAGLNTSTGSMSTPVGSSATTVTISADTTYYAVYRSSVTNYYYE